MSQQLLNDELESRLTNREVDLSKLSAEEQFAILKSRGREIIDEHRLLQQLSHSKQTGDPLRVKYGIDPTAREVHLGHIVPIIIARRFLQMGHHVIIVIGDFTAFIGDPTGRLQSRPILAPEQIADNVRLYKEQISRFINTSKVEIVFNSSFYSPDSMTIRELMTILQKNPIAPLLQREDFKKRQQSGLTIAEVLYPTLMAIDSIKLQAQVELGGIDQLLNFQVTKTFMKRQGIESQTAITTDLLESPAGDGKKMSKSEGNYIPISAPADQVYGKIMSIPDKLMESYFKLLTDISDQEWLGLAEAMKNNVVSPKEVKQLLSRIIVTWIYSGEVAQDAETKFSKIFSKRETPKDIHTELVTWRQSLSWIDIFTNLKLVSSRSAFRRLVESKAVKFINDPNIEKLLTDFNEIVKPGDFTLKYGRGKFVRVIIK